MALNMQVKEKPVYPPYHHPTNFATGEIKTSFFCRKKALFTFYIPKQNSIYQNKFVNSTTAQTVQFRRLGLKHWERYEYLSFSCFPWACQQQSREWTKVTS